MSPSRRSLPLVLLILVLGVVFAAVMVWMGSDEPEEALALTPDQDAETVAALSRDRRFEPIPQPEVPVPKVYEGDTTVLWPVRVELDLVQADYLPTEKGIPPVGSGATAKLVGRITDRRDFGARAEIRFLAGANAGRVLHTDVTGRFGATDLYPGLSVVEISGQGLFGSRREIRLRQRQQTHLNIGYGRPGSMNGRVQNKEGVGLEGATVWVDGTKVMTGPDGGFFAGTVAAGQVLVEVECPGYTAHKELVSITGGKLLTEEQGTITLRESASLEIHVTNNVGGPGPVHVILLPAQLERRMDARSVQRNSGFPWHRVNPIEVWPGRSKKVDGLPVTAVKLYAFRAGAEAPRKVLTLREGETYNVELPLTPGPKLVGRVRQDGEPVAGAIVRLEAPNRVRATLAYYQEQSFFLESAVMPELPAAVQEVQTDAEGRFTLSARFDVSKARLLEAFGPEEGTWAGRLVHAGEEVVDLDLEDVGLADAELVLDFPDRWQGLPLEILIDGQPFDPIVLPPYEPQRIRDLRAGEWGLKVTWNSDPLYAEDSFTIDGVATRTVVLPQEARDGQNEEQWERAGKQFPFGN